MLTLTFEDFAWERPAGRKKGFAWEGTGEAMRLVRLPGVAFKTYQPHSGLYREFAGLQETPKSIVRFANRYGSLGEVSRPDMGEVSHGRFTEDWLARIRRMRLTVALADAVGAGELAAIRKALVALFLLDQAVLEGDLLLGEVMRGANPDPRRLTPDEVAMVAARRLYYPLRGCLDLHAAATWNSRKKSVDVRLRYWGIWEFMYAQMCIALVQGWKFQQCVACGKWFQLSPGVNRADRSSCSPSCRFTLYRRRKQQAQGLHEEGKTPKQIAREVGSSVETIKNWLSPNKG